MEFRQLWSSALRDYGMCGMDIMNAPVRRGHCGCLHMMWRHVGAHEYVVAWTSADLSHGDMDRTPSFYYKMVYSVAIATFYIHSHVPVQCIYAHDHF